MAAGLYDGAVGACGGHAILLIAGRGELAARRMVRCLPHTLQGTGLEPERTACLEVNSVVLQRIYTHRTGSCLAVVRTSAESHVAPRSGERRGGSSQQLAWVRLVRGRLVAIRATVSAAFP